MIISVLAAGINKNPSSYNTPKFGQPIIGLIPQENWFAFPQQPWITFSFSRIHTDISTDLLSTALLQRLGPLAFLIMS